MLEGTLQCALAQDYPAYEVVVVYQDIVPPACLAALQRLHPERLRVFSQQPPHANRARNRAIAESRGEIILSIDDDVRFGPDYARRHARRFQADRSVGFVMSLTIDGPDDTAAAALVRSAQTYALSTPPQAGDVFAITWAPTCSTSYLREALLAAGLFDDYFTGGVADDSDIAVGIRDEGWRGVLDSGIELIHLAVPSGGFGSRDPGRPFRRLLNDQRMRVYFAAKHFRHMGTGHALAFYWSAFRATALAFRTRHGRLAALGAPFYFAWMATGATWSARTRRRRRR